MNICISMDMVIRIPLPPHCSCNNTWISRGYWGSSSIWSAPWCIRSYNNKPVVNICISMDMGIRIRPPQCSCNNFCIQRKLGIMIQRICSYITTKILSVNIWIMGNMRTSCIKYGLITSEFNVISLGPIADISVWDFQLHDVISGNVLWTWVLREQKGRDRGR